MYIPKVFAQGDLKALHQLIRSNSFGVLICKDGIPTSGAPSDLPSDQYAMSHAPALQTPTSLAVTHLPFVLDPGRGSYGTLIGHIARANPQWKSFRQDREALVIFQGPHAYISPSWYEDQVPLAGMTAANAQVAACLYLPLMV